MSVTPRKSKKAGLAPGTPIYIGDDEAEESHISEFSYNEDYFKARKVRKIKAIIEDIQSPDLTWVSINGLNTQDVTDLGESIGFHPLTIEDILNTEQRPKVEEYLDYIFFVLKTLSYDEEEEILDVNQVSLILGKNYVVSFHENDSSLFDPVRNRIEKDKGIIRKMGADYLAYSLIDVVVDNYFSVLEQLGDQVEFIEDELVENPQVSTLHKIYDMKRKMIILRKNIWPLREVIARLDRLGSRIFKETTSVYLRDVYDHTIQVIDAVETYRDLLSGMLDIYLSSISNKMNEVMKVLTIIGTVFIPLTFLAGIYGMNFKYMPELGWRLSYPILWIGMIMITIVMVLFFRRKKWL